MQRQAVPLSPARAFLERNSVGMERPAARDSGVAAKAKTIQNIGTAVNKQRKDSLHTYSKIHSRKRERKERSATEPLLVSQFHCLNRSTDMTVRPD